MRKASSNVSYVFGENQEFIGVSLGYDYCAEHEWGIKGIKREFGLDSEKIGLEARSITKCNPKEIIYKEKGDLALLRTEYWSSTNDDPTFEQLLPRDLYLNSSKELQTAWSEDSFCVLGEKEKVKELFDAFNELNIAFATINDTPAFGGTSLCILIKDKVPQEVKDQLDYVDNRSRDLTKYETEIGLTKLKEDKFKSHYNNDFDETKDKYWLALSPRWINYKDEDVAIKEKKNTKYDIQYWVNYGDNKTYGWFTVEQIKKWLETPGLKLSTLGGTNG